MKESQDYLQRAVAVNPSLIKTWIALGMVSYEKRTPIFALSALSRAVHEDPADAKAHNYLARNHWQEKTRLAGRSRGRELQRAIALNPDYANAHFNLALMYLERKPPALELAKRHYTTRRSHWAQKEAGGGQKLKEK